MLDTDWLSECDHVLHACQSTVKLRLDAAYDKRCLNHWNRVLNPDLDHDFLSRGLNVV